MIVLGLGLFGHWQLGIVAGTSTLVAMVAGTLAGSGVPLVMRRLGIDPAQSSAIVLIMITDATAFATLLTLSFLLLGGMNGAGPIAP